MAVGVVAGSRRLLMTLLVAALSGGWSNVPMALGYARRGDSGADGLWQSDLGLRSDARPAYAYGTGQLLVVGRMAVCAAPDYDSRRMATFALLIPGRGGASAAAGAVHSEWLGFTLPASVLYGHRVLRGGHPDRGVAAAARARYLKATVPTTESLLGHNGLNTGDAIASRTKLVLVGDLCPAPSLRPALINGGLFRSYCDVTKGGAMIGWAGLAGAFLAGLLSFVSPCVLPLTPIYIAQLVGPGVWQLATAERDERLRIRRVAFAMALAFVGGFSLAFIALGATASELGGLLVAHAALLRQVGGIVLIALGLYVTGLLPLPWLDRTGRIPLRVGKPGLPHRLSSASSSPSAGRRASGRFSRGFWRWRRRAAR